MESIAQATVTYVPWGLIGFGISWIPIAKYVLREQRPFDFVLSLSALIVGILAIVMNP